MTRQPAEYDGSDLPVYDVHDQVDAYDAAGPVDVEDLEPRPPRLGRREWIAIGVVAVLALGALIGVRVHAGRDAAAPPVPASPTPTTALAAGEHLVETPHGSVADVAVGTHGVFVLQHGPDRLTRLPLGDSSLRDLVYPPVGALKIALDDAHGVVWTLAPSTMQTTTLRAYDLRRSGDLTHAAVSEWGLAGTAENMAVVDGTAWVVSDSGLLAVAGTAVHAFHVGDVEAITTDRDAHRVLFVVRQGATSVLWSGAVSAAGAVSVRRLGALPVRATSLVVAGSVIWINGGGDHATSVMYDVAAGTQLVVLDSRPGAPGRVLASGDYVLWSGDGSAITCWQSFGGIALHRWPGVEGPVASVSGFIYAVADGHLVRLDPVRSCGG